MAGARRESAVFTVVVTALVLLCAVPITIVVAMSGAPRVTVLAGLLAAVPVGPTVYNVELIVFRTNATLGAPENWSTETAQAPAAPTPPTVVPRWW